MPPFPLLSSINLYVLVLFCQWDQRHHYPNPITKYFRVYYLRMRSFFFITPLKNFNIDPTLLFNPHYIFQFVICLIHVIFFVCLFFPWSRIYTRDTHWICLLCCSSFLYFRPLLHPRLVFLDLDIFVDLGYSDISSRLDSCYEFFGHDTTEMMSLLCTLRLNFSKWLGGLRTNQLKSHQRQSNI